MFFIILTSVGLIIGVVCTVLYMVAPYNWDIRENLVYIFSWIGWIICVIFAFSSLVFLPCEFTISKEFIYTFKQQKYYIEEIVPTLPVTDNYALTQKRIELNQELYRFQYYSENRSFFFFYPEELKNLEPIK